MSRQHSGCLTYIGGQCTTVAPDLHRGLIEHDRCEDAVEAPVPDGRV